MYLKIVFILTLLLSAHLIAQKSEKVNNKPNIVFIEWINDMFAQYRVLLAYRTPKWKLILDLSSKDNDEFYHLEKDPGETKNLINSTELEIFSKREKMKLNLLKKMWQINDQNNQTSIKNR